MKGLSCAPRTVATRQTWLFKFKLVTGKLKLSSSQATATFRVLSSCMWLGPLSQKVPWMTLRAYRGVIQALGREAVLTLWVPLNLEGCQHP